MFFYKSYKVNDGAVTRQIKVSFKTGLFEILNLNLKHADKDLKLL